MRANCIVLCITDAVGRSHGDVNCDSLLVQPVKCSIAKTHREEWTARPAFCSTPPCNLLSCATAIQFGQDKPGLVTLYLWGALSVNGHVVWPRVMGNVWQGQAEGKGGHERCFWIIESDYLVTYGWWLSGNGMINCTKWELHFLISVLSIYLPFSAWPPILYHTFKPLPSVSLYM